MTGIDDMAVYQAIRDAGDDGLTSAELAERFKVEFWAMHNVCLKLRDGALIGSRSRKGTSKYMWVALPPGTLTGYLSAMSFRWGSKVLTIVLAGAASAFAATGLVWVVARFFALTPGRML